jgi:hypothetical protein
MKALLNRKEFLGMFVPSRNVIGNVGRIVKGTIYLFCCLLGVRLLMGITFESWSVLAFLALKTVLPIVALVCLASSARDRLQRSSSVRIRRGAKAIGKVFVALSYMATGALWYDLWLKKPAETVVGAVVVATMIAIGWFDRTRESEQESVEVSERS